MKYFNILLTLLYIPSSILGFVTLNNVKTRYSKLKMANDEIITEVLKYKNVLSESTYNTLISKIKTHDIQKIYVTNTLDAIIAKDNDDNELLTDYSITKINPMVVKTIVDESNKNNIETFFLEVLATPPAFTEYPSPIRLGTK
jgi:hypothetical protein